MPVAALDRDAAPSSTEIAGSRHRVIAVIGINQYRHWTKLQNAVRDATDTAAQFDALGFRNVAALLDDEATGDAMRRLVSADVLSLGPDDSFVLFYAGHGASRKYKVGNKEIEKGYVVPVDAREEEVATWINLEEWLRQIAVLPAKHILVILDSCHSGIALHPAVKWRDVSIPKHRPLAALDELPSRRVITSALHDEVVCDGGPLEHHSLFTGCLLEGLTGGIRPSNRLVTTGSELALYVRQRVDSYPKSRKQTPDFGAFDWDERGEMLIPLAIDGDGQLVTLEIRLAAAIKSFDRMRFLAAISSLLGREATSIEITDIRSGSVIVTLRMRAEERTRLLAAFDKHSPEITTFVNNHRLLHLSWIDVMGMPQRRVVRTRVDVRSIYSAARSYAGVGAAAALIAVALCGIGWLNQRAVEERSCSSIIRRETQGEISTDTTIRGDTVCLEAASIVIRGSHSLTIQATTVRVLNQSSIEGDGSPGAAGSPGYNAFTSTQGGCLQGNFMPDADGRLSWCTQAEDDWRSANDGCRRSPPSDPCEIGGPGSAGEDGAPGPSVIFDVQEPPQLSGLALHLIGGAGGAGGAGGLGARHYYLPECPSDYRRLRPSAIAPRPPFDCPPGPSGAAGAAGAAGHCLVRLNGQERPCNDYR
jgi:uncharacterized caspase-like protein